MQGYMQIMSGVEYVPSRTRKKYLDLQVFIGRAVCLYIQSLQGVIATSGRPAYSQPWFCLQ